MGIDRPGMNAMLAGAVAPVLMLGNRWVVAQEQARTLAELLKQGTRPLVAHRLSRLAAVPLSPYKVLHRARKRLAPRASDKSIELVKEVCPNLPMRFIGDPICLIQVLVNLIGSTTKFMPQCHVQLHVEDVAPSRKLGGVGTVTVARWLGHVPNAKARTFHGPGTSAMARLPCAGLFKPS